MASNGPEEIPASALDLRHTSFLASPPPAPPPTPDIPSMGAGTSPPPFPPIGLGAALHCTLDRDGMLAPRDESDIAAQSSSGLKAHAEVPSILARLGAFLPQMEAANQELEERMAAEGDGRKRTPGQSSSSGIAALQIDATMAPCEDDDNSSSSSSSEKDGGEDETGQCQPMVEMTVALGDFSGNPLMDDLITPGDDDGKTGGGLCAEAGSDNLVDNDETIVSKSTLVKGLLGASSNVPGSYEAELSASHDGQPAGGCSQTKKRKFVIEELT